MIRSYIKESAMLPFRWLTAACLLVAAGIALSGCSADEAKKLLDKGIEQVQKLPETVTKEGGKAGDQVQEQLGLAGNIHLSLSPELNKSACYVKFVPATGGRPSVLQLQSYRAADQESFSSVFLQAQVTATSLAELAGQSVQAQLFVQPQSGGPVWFTDREHPVELKIAAIDEKLLTAEFTGGSLQSTDGAAAAGVAGKFSGVLP
jgi:hypothetical protein